MRKLFYFILAITLFSSCQNNAIDREKLKKEITDSLMSQIRNSDKVKQGDSVNGPGETEFSAEETKAQESNRCWGKTIELNSLIQKYKGNDGSPKATCDEKGITADFPKTRGATVAYEDIISIYTLTNDYTKSIEINIVVSGTEYLLISTNISDKINIFRLADLIKEVTKCTSNKVIQIEHRTF